MEYDEKSVIIGIGENLLIEAHHLLLVTAEEVDLYAANAVVVHPLHLTATGDCVIHDATRSLRSVIPVAVELYHR